MGPPPGFRPPEKSNTGLFIGIGCGVFALIGIVAVVLYFTVFRGDGDDDTTAETGETAPETKPAPPQPKPPGVGKIELRDIRFYKKRSTWYVVGELWNIGAGPVNSPGAKITVYDASKTALDSGSCTQWSVHDLQPNDNVPCRAILTKAKGWKTYKVEPKARKAYIKYRPASLKISNMNSTKGRWGVHKVTGKVTNNSSFRAKSVWVIVGLYDKNKKIAGSGNALIAGNDLDAGASAKFTVSIYNVAKRIEKSRAIVYGYDR